LGALGDKCSQPVAEQAISENNVGFSGPKRRRPLESPWRAELASNFARAAVDAHEGVLHVLLSSHECPYLGR